MIQIRCSALALAALAAGCTPSAMNLRPRQVPPQEGAVFGVISAVNQGREIISGCTARFSGADPARSRELLLDETGWVFTTLPLGPMSLASLDCGEKLTYAPKSLVTHVRGAGKIAYFGRVQVDFDYTPPDAEVGAAGAALGGALGGALRAAAATTEQRGDPALHLSNRFALDRAEYLRRFPADAAALQAEIDLFAEGRTIPTLPAPTSGVGFPLGQPRAAAQAACLAAASTWSAEQSGFSCSGPALDLGMPARVKLRLCGEKVCEIVVDVGADGADWKALAPRYGALVQRLTRDLGPRLARTTRALSDCDKGISDCFALGRVSSSLRWRWPDRHLVSLILDGGPAGGPPSLFVRYQTPAALDEDEKPDALKVDPKEL
jgi:hypothetical protein